MPSQGDIPLGLCQCGCGQPTKIATRTSRKRGTIRGVPQKYACGHKGIPIHASYRVDQKTGCWNWTGKLTRYGRPRIRRDGRLRFAYVILYEEMYGPVPKGTELHHRCENPACVCPDHVTPLARAPHRQAHSSLTWDDVREIRSLRGKVRQVDLARRFGVPQSHISKIQLGETWRE